MTEPGRDQSPYPAVSGTTQHQFRDFQIHFVERSFWLFP